MKTKACGAGLLLLIACGTLSIVASPWGGPEVNATAEAPLSIAASSVGRFAKGHSWHLSMNSAGQAEITIDATPKPIRRQFQVAPEQIQALRDEVARQRFFDLDKEYGQRVPDGSTDTTTVIVGDRVKTVKTRFLMNWVHGDVSKLVEPSRVVRIQVMIRGWFNDKEAVDLRKYDRMVLNAVKESDPPDVQIDLPERGD